MRTAPAGHPVGMAFRETLGIEIADKGGGRARLRMVAQDRHLNDAGVVHGGAIATLVDCAMGSAVASIFEEPALTVETKINYLEPGRPGALVATASVRREGKRFTVLEAEVVQEEDGTHVAFAIGTMTITG